LFDSDYLSLAEVQVMGVDLLRFSEVDYSSSQNDFDGFNNSPNYANKRGFAAIKDDGLLSLFTQQSVRLWIMICLMFFSPPRSTCHQAPCS
jgi:hypothetical protein